MARDTRFRRSVSIYLGNMRERNLSESYIGQSRRLLSKFADHCEQYEITAATRVKGEHLKSFLERYRQCAASHQAQTWAILKAYLMFMEHPLAGKFRPAIIGRPRYRVRWLTPEEIDRVLSTPMDLREAVLVTMGLLQGARPCEPLRLTVRDAKLSLKTGRIRFVAKRKERSVKLHPETRLVLMKYLERSEKPDDALLLGIKSCRAWGILQGVGKRIGIKLEGHTMRRSYSKMLLLKGVRLEYISKLLGHSDTVTTMGYLGLTDEDVDLAVGLIEVPHVRTITTGPVI